MNHEISDEDVMRVFQAAREADQRYEEREWGEPQPLPGGLPEVPAFDEHLLPDSLRSWIADIAERAQAPLDYPAAGAIAALSSVIGRRFGIRPKRHDDWLVVPNLWGLVVGSPGLLKSPLIHEVLKPLSRLEARARESNQEARAAYEVQEVARQAERRKLCAQAARPKSDLGREDLVSALRELQAGPPAERRYVVNDSTVEKLGEILNQNPCGVLLFRDEIAGFLASMERAGHENDRAFYLEAWGGTSSYTYDRIARGTLHIEAACISVLGCITPGPLSAYLREAFGGSRADGLIQRFQLGVYPDLPRSWHNVDRAPDDDAKQRAFTVFERLAALSPTVGQPSDIPAVHFDAEAQDFFDGWREDLERQLRTPDEHPVVVAHLSKYRSLMPSLALIFHAAERADEPGFVSSVSATIAGLSTTFSENDFGAVPLMCAQRAAAWCEYLEAHARRIYYSGVTARVDTAVRLMGEKIKAAKLTDKFTSRDVYRPQWAGLTEREDVIRALEVLEDLVWVKSETIPPTTTGGRPSRRYHVNPRIPKGARGE